MSLSNQKHYLDLSSGVRAPVTVHVSQGDVGREITFALLNNGKEITLTTESVSVHGTRIDGAAFGPFACTYTSGHLVTFETQENMTAIAGSAIAELVITDGSGTKIGTANFAMLIEESTFPNGLSYDTDPSVYENILKYTQEVNTRTTQRVDAFERAVTTEVSEFKNTVTTGMTNHEATVANQISEFEDSIENTVSQIIASAGDDNTEIVNARQVFDGTAKQTLKLRLDEFLEYDIEGTTDGIGTVATLSEEITAAVIAWLSTHPANLVYAADGTISFYTITSTEDILYG